MRLPHTKTLRVFPNPWGVHPAAVIEGRNVDSSTLDHEGRPCGVVFADAYTDGGESKRLVGAAWCDVHTKVGAVPAKRHAVTVGNIWKPQQRTVYTFLGCTGHETRPYQLAEELAKADPVSLPVSEYYRAHVASGELIAADEKTAKQCGVPFEDPKTLFLKLAKAGAKAFDSQYEGEAAYEHFVKERAEAMAAEAGEPAPVPQPATEPATPSAKRVRAADTTNPKETS